MKSKFTKILFGIISVLCFILDSQMSFAQWTFNTMGNNFTTPFNPNSIANTNGTGTVNYTGQRLRSNIVPEGLVLKGNYLYDPTVYNQALNDGVQQALNSIPIEKWFKATVGKNDTIRINYQYNKYNNVAGRPQQVNNLIANYSVYGVVKTQVLNIKIRVLILW